MVSDYEGPIDLCDHALGITCYALEPHGINGEVFFKNLGNWVIRESKDNRSFSPGDTLLYLLPFLRAAGMTYECINQVARQNANLVSGAHQIFPVSYKGFQKWLLSTTYSACINNEALGLASRDAIGTQLNGFDRVMMPVKEQQLILDVAAQISHTEDIDETNCLMGDVKTTVSWGLLRQIDVINQRRKAQELRTICLMNNFERGVYVGDSIVDETALQAARELGLLALSLNGTAGAVECANIVAITYDPAAAFAKIAYLLRHHDSLSTLLRACRPSLKIGGGFLATVVDSNVEHLQRKSAMVRGDVRKVAGGLP